jgi:hypothetical protein
MGWWDGGFPPPARRPSASGHLSVSTNSPRPHRLLTRLSSMNRRTVAISPADVSPTATHGAAHRR